MSIYHGTPKQWFDVLTFPVDTGATGGTTGGGAAGGVIEQPKTAGGIVLIILIKHKRIRMALALH